MASFEQPNLPVHPFPDWKNHFINGTKQWVNGHMPWEYGMDFDNVNLPYTCNVCKRGDICGVDLIRCDKCNVVHYCSNECKEQAKSSHKLICKRIHDYANTVVKKGGVALPHDRESYQNFLTAALLELTPLYKAQSSEWDRQKANSHWESQQHCQICFKSPFLCCLPAENKKSEPVTSSPLDLSICRGCHSVSCCNTPTCKAQFKELHSPESCERYLAFYASKILSMQFGNSPVMNCGGRVDTSFYDNRGFVDNWTDYFSLKMETFELPAGLIQLPPVMGMLTDGLSFPMTILWGLFRAYPLTELLAMQTVEIHVLGAEYAEANGAADKYEEILHWLPNCRDLKVVLSGPYISEEGSFTTDELCEACTDIGGCTLTIHEVKGFYHDLVAQNETLEELPTLGQKRRLTDTGDESDESEKDSEFSISVRVHDATLLICCHSGVHDTVSSDKFEQSLRTTWKDTVDVIAKSGKPCVFTGYTTEEIVADAAALTNWNCKITVTPRENSFRGLLAYPEVASDNQFYYSNHSCLMIQGCAAPV